MSEIPFTSPAPWPAIAPGRFAASLAAAPRQTARIALLGLPDDLGVRLNGGRPGAALGPAAFRAALARYGSSYDAAAAGALPADLVWDAGDILPASGSDPHALSETHTRVTAALSALHRLGLVPVCIGGGHDLTFPAIRALAQHLPRETGAPPILGGINLDAHLDVRPEPGSGMPFRALIEGGHLDPQRFVTFGAGRFANSADHSRYLLVRRAIIIEVTHALARPSSLQGAFEIMESAPAGFVSIDLDGIDGSQAPGVSAVNPMGLPVSLACEAAALAGRSTRVRHFDLMELSPPHDDPPWNPADSPSPGRTARLAALLFLHFVAGFAGRAA